MKKQNSNKDLEITKLKEKVNISQLKEEKNINSDIKDSITEMKNNLIQKDLEINKLKAEIENQTKVIIVLIYRRIQKLIMMI